MPKIRPAGSPLEIFDHIQKLISKSPQSNEISDLFLALAIKSFEYLKPYTVKSLKTNIPNKSYVSYVDNANKSSRPVNLELFRDIQLIESFISAVKTDTLKDNFTSKEITSACYSLVVSFACAIDLINPGDRQTPGTF